jgi:hypothetical protein
MLLQDFVVRVTSLNVTIFRMQKNVSLNSQERRSDSTFALLSDSTPDARGCERLGAWAQPL